MIYLTSDHVVSTTIKRLFKRYYNLIVVYIHISITNSDPVEWRGKHTVSVALLVRLEAKPGKEAEVERFIRDGLSIVQGEPATTAWFGIRMGPSTFGIFDAFPDESGRQAHLSGRVAAALKEKASDLLSQAPVIEKVDILAAKLPQ